MGQVAQARQQLYETHKEGRSVPEMFFFFIILPAFVTMVSNTMGAMLLYRKSNKK